MKKSLAIGLTAFALTLGAAATSIPFIVNGNEVQEETFDNVIKLTNGKVQLGTSQEVKVSDTFTFFGKVNNHDAVTFAVAITGPVTKVNFIRNINGEPVIKDVTEVYKGIKDGEGNVCYYDGTNIVHEAKEETKAFYWATYTIEFGTEKHTDDDILVNLTANDSVVSKAASMNMNMVRLHTAELDKGTLKDNKFEFEDAEIENGPTGPGNDHFCLERFAFSKDFSGGIGTRWIKTGTTFTFKFTSDKAVRAFLDINLSGSYIEAGTKLASYYDARLNGHKLVDTSALLPTTGHQADGMNNYFLMANCESSVLLNKGENVLTLKAIHKNSQNPDFINIRTSANIKNTTVSTYESPILKGTLVKPTATAKGKLSWTCPTDNKVISFNIPTIGDKFYSTVNETKDTVDYVMTARGENRVVNKGYRLTLSEGAKLAGDKVEAKFVAGDKVTINYAAPENKMLTGWVNANDPKETFPVEFVMPEHAITLKPVLASAVKHTLTLKGLAKFADGTTSKLVTENEQVEIIVDEIPGKKHIGWATSQNVEDIIPGTTFVMPAKDMAIAPLYESINKVPNFGTRYDKANNFNVKTDAGVQAVVMDEQALVINASNVQAGAYITLGTNLKTGISSSHEYDVTTTIYNLSNQALTIRFNQYNKWGEAGKSTANSIMQEPVTIEPMTPYTFKAHIKGWNNASIYTRLYLDNASTLSAFTFGTYGTLTQTK